MIRPAPWLAPALLALAVAFASPAAARGRPALIVIYNGLGTEARARLWGRALYDRGLGPAQPDESRWRKLKRSVGELDSHEMRRVALTMRLLGRSYSVRTDHEGLFQLDVTGPLPVGTHDVDARIEHAAGFRTQAGRLMIFPRKPGVAVVSDIDDTIVQTGVGHKAAMIRRVLTSNAHDLRTYAGAPSLYKRWADRGYPIVFVSGSPVNLYSRLASFLELRGFPPAALLLKNLGLEKGADSLFGQREFKLRRIREVKQLLPGYRLLLVGDSGEKDPEIYRRLRDEDPRSVQTIMIHLVTGEPAAGARFQGQLVFDTYARLGGELFKRGQLSGAELTAVQQSAGRAGSP